MNDGFGSNIGEALNDCIDRLNGGQSLEDCLARYPQWAAELRPMLLAGLRVREAQASPGELAAARARTRARLERELRRPAPVRPWRPAWSPLALAASLILVLAFAIAGGGVILNAIQNEATPTLIVTLTPAASLSPTPTETETSTQTVTPTPTPTQTATPSPIWTPAVTATLPATATVPATGIVPATATAPVTISPAPSVPLSATACVAALPAGWVTYRVRAGDTLSGLALNTGTTVAELRRINCLAGDVIVVGQLLYLPRLPVQSPGGTVSPLPPAGGGQLDPGQSGAGSGSTNTNDNGDDSPDDNSNDNTDDHGGSSGSGSSNDNEH